MAIRVKNAKTSGFYRRTRHRHSLDATRHPGESRDPAVAANASRQRWARAFAGATEIPVIPAQAGIHP